MFIITFQHGSRYTKQFSVSFGSSFGSGWDGVKLKTCDDREECNSAFTDWLFEVLTAMSIVFVDSVTWHRLFWQMPLKR
jgi:hypothetical protein